MTVTKDLLNPQHSIHYGFLTINQDANGFFGAYLVTNRWARPIEFRISSAVQPNKVQHILYGEGLKPFIYSEVIAKTLVEKSSQLVDLVVTDLPEVLGLRKKLDIPVVCLAKAEDAAPEGTHVITGPRGVGLHLAGTIEEAELFTNFFESLDIDLAEPFIRIRDAVQETRKTTTRTTSAA